MTEQKPTAEATSQAHNLLMIVLNAGHSQCRCCHMISHELEPMNHTKGCVVHDLAALITAKDAEIERWKALSHKVCCSYCAFTLPKDDPEMPDKMATHVVTCEGSPLVQQNQQQRALLVELCSFLSRASKQVNFVSTGSHSGAYEPSDIAKTAKYLLSTPAVVEMMNNHGESTVDGTLSAFKTIMDNSPDTLPTGDKELLKETHGR